MKKLLFSFIIMFSTWGCLLGQEKLLYEKTMNGYTGYVLKEFNMVCKMPDKFINLDKYNVILKIRKDKDKHVANMYGPVFLSRDSDCIAMYCALPHRSSEQFASPVYPRSQITAEIKTALGLFYFYNHPLNKNSSPFDFNKHVTTVADKKARKMFNADSVYIYDIPGADSVYFLNRPLEKMREHKYPYCTGVFISKNDRAAMDVKLFFTEKGKKNKEKYINLLKKRIWYK
jgi:hypothetical protein